MRIVSAEELLLAGVRCGRCDRFFLVAEGAAVPWCCAEERSRGREMRLEHHTHACLENCDDTCSCPCHPFLQPRGMK